MRTLFTSSRLLCLLVLATLSLNGRGAVSPDTEAATDSVEEKNQLTVDAQILSRGELRMGGFTEDEEYDNDDFAAFLMERTRLSFAYSRSFLDVKIVPQHSGVWGQAGKGSLNLYETWVQLRSRKGFFAKIGRQELSYDNERIIGSNDWAMAASSHDVAKFGYEGHGHKVHLILGFNQNAENTNGGTYYENGAHPYKSMQTVWYHYDMPRIPLGASFLFMNLGTQNVHTRRTEFQKLAGGYLLYKPNPWLFEGSFYYQFGNNENGQPIKAWMGSLKAQYRLNPQWRFTGGYDYMTGDEFYYVRGKGQAGLIFHKEQRGFSTLYGSHHQFYGAMDFFYLSVYADGFSPGLQNAFFDIDYTPVKNVELSASYHYLATTTSLKEVGRPLGHEIELGASYRFMRDASLSAGYSFMKGTSTMRYLKNASDNGRLQWLWLSLSVSPRLFTTKW